MNISEVGLYILEFEIFIVNKWAISVTLRNLTAKDMDINFKIRFFIETWIQ